MAFSSFLKTFLLPRHKKIVLFILAVILVLGILLPIQSTQAASWLHYLNPVTWFSSVLDSLESAATAVLNATLVLIFTILNALAITILEISQAIFRWVSSPGFMGVSFTGPDNIVVQEGWKMLLNFANAGFLLGLVYVGLVTAFNVAGYNTKKLLLRLLIGALLVNFTPVLCGAVIDGSNIFTNYFLFSTNTLASGTDQLFAEEFTSIAKDILGSPGIVLVKALAFLGFNLILAFVLLTFAALFLLRYAVLWLLVIISPLAILAWTLGELSPQLKSIWEKWLKNFVNWSIIAVPAAFVIYLADHLLAFAKKSELVAESEDIAAFSPSFSRTLTEYGLPIIFLLVGFFFTLSTSAQGSSFIISKAKQAGRAAGGAAAKGGKVLARKTATTTAKGAAGFAAGRKEAKEQASNFAQRWTSSVRGGIPGAFKEDTVEKGTRQAEEWATRKGKTPFGYARRTLGRTVLKAGVKSEQGAYEVKQKKAEQFDLQTNASRYQNANQLGKLAIASQAIKKGEFDKLVEKADIQPEEAKNLYRSAIHLRDDKTQKGIERHFAADIGEELGNIAQELGKYTLEQKEKDRYEKGYTSYTGKIVAEAKDQEAIKQLSASLGANKAHSDAIDEAIHKFWGGSQIEKAVETAGSKFTESFRQSAPTMEWYLEIDDNTHRVRNADGAFYRAGTVAQRSGLGFTEDVTMKDLKTKFAEKQKESQKILPEVLRIRRMGENARKKQAEQEKSTPKKKTKRRKRKFSYYKKH